MPANLCRQNQKGMSRFGNRLLASFWRATNFSPKPLSRRHLLSDEWFSGRCLMQAMTHGMITGLSTFPFGMQGGTSLGMLLQVPFKTWQGFHLGSSWSKVNRWHTAFESGYYGAATFSSWYRSSFESKRQSPDICHLRHTTAVLFSRIFGQNL